ALPVWSLPATGKARQPAQRPVPSTLDEHIVQTGNSAAPGPTFYRDVLPILQVHCQSCHRSGEIAPMPLVTYEETRHWAGKIRELVASGKMPPWFADPRYGHFSNDPSLTAQQIETISAWVSANAPAGRREDAPAAPLWTREWNIASPDVVLRMPEAVSI